MDRPRAAAACLLPPPPQKKTKLRGSLICVFSGLEHTEIAYGHFIIVEYDTHSSPGLGTPHPIHGDSAKLY